MGVFNEDSESSRSGSSDSTPVLKAGKKFEIQRVEKTPESNENTISVKVPCETCEREASDLSNALQSLLKDHRDGEPIVSDGNLSSYEKNLYLYHEEMPERPRVATLLNSLANYNVAIPSVSENAVSAPKKANLGTIAGVYLPCIQNILGVIFFIRMGWIVGTAGVPLAFLVVFLSCCVTFTTCISLSAIATNGIVPAGGSYFMISRSLGPEFGGAVGILFYLATSIAAAMYVIGAVEIFLNYMAPGLSLYGDFRSDPEIMYHNYRTYGTILLIIVGIIVFIGVKFVSKFAPIALFCVIVSLVSVYVGVFTNFHGKEGLEICVLGDRLLSKTNYTCSKNQNDTKSLFFLYCNEVNKTDSGESLYSCDTYFDNHEVYTKLAIPGMSSDVFSTNIPSRFRLQGDYISEAINREAASSYGQKPFNQILVDLTTSFTVLVAIFFPSCTGILAGSNRSGDLADAQKSIPTGTLAAQLTTSLIYLSGVVLFGATFDNLFMRDKLGASIGGGLAVADLAWPHPMVVIVGSFLSTIGAGLQSLTGAPRLLQAIAKDQLIPFLKIFSHSSSRNEPTRALFLTLFIAEIGILIGNLDHIAPILTMFFLMCYMFVNLACVLQSLLHTPNWRPRFKYYHWSLSMVGSILCLVVMFLSSWYYALIAIGIAGCVYKYIEYSGAEKEWGDGIRGLALSAARYSLLRLEEGPPHTKNWRPQVLVLCKLDEELNPKYPRLFSFASQLKAGKGLTIVCSVLEGSFEKMYSEAQAAKLSLKRTMEDEKVKGFADVLVAKELTEGICNLIQTAGLGGLKHNTVILSWPYGWRQSADEKQWRVFLHTIRSVSASKNALLVPKGINLFPSNNEKVSGNIDVWWIVHDGGLLMLLPFLLKQHKTWKNCKLRIFTVAQLEDNSIQMKKDLAKFLYHLRIEADVEVVEMMDSDISAYTYERTLLMEQRNEILKQLKLSCHGTSSFSDVQNIVDHHHHQANNKTGSRVRFNEVTEEIKDIELVDVTDGDTNEENAALDDSNASGEGDTNESFDKLLAIRPDEANVRRMHTAVKLNEVIVAKSHNAQLVILNLPGLPKASAIKANYMEFLEVLTEGLERVLMVRGGGREVITIYS
ncbi:solute carrier family 12 member 6 [Trichonephila inaurata madagascariensis]|uniref:Solute carrier family 12 member 6 n=1 Tax=Trichonephila inaurata madagascariensis TaxID=2747483 RepID=A0A8X6X2B2_9ARAC|nr:solute carrier family 12 member 6 [Trichonephila inaurata madagascariensis]